ncbi:probable salivary secreted peptide [Neodiprion virginianus]|uniref:probable salivary secreted peptide n=1 Tax=Neodiprion virginianus TaxID=2961670 RepID=UPI00076FD3DB|nr:probable salivary secreted peptide [Neodiprion virginianus]
MFKRCSILVAFVTAVAVAANVIPRAFEQRGTANVTYVGNNLYIGNRTKDDWLHKTVNIFKSAVPFRVVNETWTMTTYFNLTYLEAIDNAVNKTLGAYPTLVSGGPGQRNTTLLFNSKTGQPINFTLNAYVRY